MHKCIITIHRQNRSTFDPQTFNIPTTSSTIQSDASHKSGTQTTDKRLQATSTATKRATLPFSSFTLFILLIFINFLQLLSPPSFRRGGRSAFQTTSDNYNIYQRSRCKKNLLAVKFRRYFCEKSTIMITTYQAIVMLISHDVNILHPSI